MASRTPRTWLPKITGGVHLRIWFAKAGRGTPNDTGISPIPARHIENGTYSFSLALFDPTPMTQKEATEAGKETSLYPGYGAQFGAQIWRMAHEAEVGDFIFLESENHHLHAVGIIAGEYAPPGDGNYTDEMFTQSGAHSIPVKWLPIKDGKDFIQLGRLDNAVFRDVAEKEDLATLLIFGTGQIVGEAMDIDHDEWGKFLSHGLKSAAPNDFSELKEHGVRLLNAAHSPDLKDDFCKFVYDNLILTKHECVFDDSSIDEAERADIEQSSADKKKVDKMVKHIKKLMSESEKEEANCSVPPDKEVALKPAATAPEPKPVDPPKVITHVARNGVYIHQAIEEAALHQLISAKTVVLTDHVYHPISINWMTVEEYLKIRGLNI